MERNVSESALPDPAAVTAADMVAGHVTLDISCLDRLYLNGYVPGLQTPRVSVIDRKSAKRVKYGPDCELLRRQPAKTGHCTSQPASLPAGDHAWTPEGRSRRTWFCTARPKPGLASGNPGGKMLRKMAKLAAMAALAAGAATAPMAVPAAHAATISAGHAVATQYTHTATTRSVHNNLTSNTSNGCNTVDANDGWSIAACSNDGGGYPWGDGYINSIGYMPPGCHIELYVWPDGDSSNPAFNSYPCSTLGHIGPLYIGWNPFGVQTDTSVAVVDGAENIYVLATYP